MIKKFISMLMIAVILCGALVGCEDNTDRNETTQGFASQDTTLPDGTTMDATLNIDDLSYPQFNALSPEDKQAVMESFDSVEEFTQWRDELKEFHEEFNDKLYSQQGTVESSEPTTVNTESTAGNTEPDIEDPVNDTTAPAETEPESDKVTFLDYQAMSGVEQKKFINSFPSIDDFMKWHADALQEYKDNMKPFDSDVTIPTDTDESGD